MDLDHLLAHITPEVYATLKQAVETGRWPDGNRLDDEQRGLCLQAVIAWGERHLPAAERVGHIPSRPHTHCGGEGEMSAAEPQPLKWLH
ncbi:MAG: DUF1315 family protein [Gammaproteobacteria bacterium]|nr:DUF1315 family protein [Gammaproteobacteria bacterium]MBK9427778.1 DUF1315 family protein [Gammaproteobacteria bacterium]